MNSENKSTAARAPPWRLFSLPLYHRIEVKAIAKKENMVTLTVAFPDDKREALEHFLAETGGRIEVCLAESMEDWYRKTVPVGVRQYLDAKWEKECGAPPGPLNIPTPEPEGSTDFPFREG